MALVHLIILLILFQSVCNQSDVNNYGPYKFVYEKIDTCKGPKPGNCGQFQLDNTNDATNLIFRFNMSNECLITAGKVILSNNHNQSPKKLWNYKVNKPCQHFVLGPILTSSFNMTNACRINKGTYSVHINLQEKSSTFLGSNFFYGSYSFKIIAFNKETNLFCIIVLVDIVPT